MAFFHLFFHFQFKDRWTFWLVISIIISFFIVLVYFTWRGFRNYKRAKKETAMSAAAGPPPVGPDIRIEMANLSPEDILNRTSIDIVELARRTGRPVSSIQALAPMSGSNCHRPLPSRTGST